MLLPLDLGLMIYRGGEKVTIFQSELSDVDRCRMWIAPIVGSLRNWMWRQMFGGLVQMLDLAHSPEPSFFGNHGFQILQL